MRQLYEVAKERLGRKFGGARRRTALFLEEIENFSNIRPNNAADLTKFADLLDILTVNLKESNMTAELGAGLLYVKLQKKLPKNKLAAYHRWLFEKKLEGSVVHLRTWILQENAFDVIAEETTRGLLGSSQRNSVDTYHGNRNTSVKKCKVCEASHELKDCPKFLGLSVGERSERVKKLGVCFGCLNEGHFKRECRANIKCDICQKSLNAVFHGLGAQTSSYHMGGNLDNTRISLRTIPIKLSYQGNEIWTNGLLDDGSTCSFINAEMAHILNIPRGDQQSLSVGVLNGASEKFTSSNVSFTIASMDGKNSFVINAMTIKSVTGQLRPVDWVEQAQKFNHLKDLSFCRPNKGKISVLIGLDHVFLHQALREVRGNQHDPIARLTPLGWTCTGKTTISGKEKESARFINSFFQNKKEIRELEKSLLQFWEIEEAPTPSKTYEAEMSVQNREINDKVKKGIRYFSKNNRYEVPIPWNEEKRNLCNNYTMARQRLENTEKKLGKNS